MKEQGKIIIGIRKSQLSTAQADDFQKKLLHVNDSYGDKSICIKYIKTSGDIHNTHRLDQLGGKGLFVKEIEDQILSGDIDIGIHSVKDLPAKETPGLKIACWLKRLSPNDVLLSNANLSLKDLPAGSVIGTSSIRRRSQILSIRKDLQIKLLRGNVDTRIKKVETGEFDGAILALAGLKTLNLEKYVKEIFSVKDFIPTAGQGIIAVQCREDDEDIRKILKKINHNKTEVCALAERSFLKTLGGDCDTAVGCSVILDKDKIELSAQLFSDDGQKVFNVVKLGKSNQPQLLGKIAGEEILKKSGNSFIKKR